MKLLRLLPLLLLLGLFVLPVLPAHAAGPTQVTPTAGCAGLGVCLKPFMAGTFIGQNSAYSQDSKGNLIAVMICASGSNVCSSDFAVLVWSSDGGNTWSSCVTIVAADCNSGGASTPSLARNSVGSSCIREAAIYVTGSTVVLAYQGNAGRGQTVTGNGVAHIYVERMNIQYSGNTITDILNNGPETNASFTGASLGLTCVHQILPTPNGGGEIMVFSGEENSGPLIMFRTTVSAAAYKDLSGVASSVTQAVTSQNDGSNECSQFQPVTGDIWHFNVYDTTNGNVFVNQFPYNSGTGNWGAVTSTSMTGTWPGTTPHDRTTSCARDSTNAYFMWFHCQNSGATHNCAHATNLSTANGNSCDFQLWEATPSSSSGSPTQLATLSDPGACHVSDGVTDTATGGGTTLTVNGGQLWFTGVDDNLFGSGCTSEGGSAVSNCQQLFLAKYTVSSNTWGAITQYAGSPFGVWGEVSFLQGTTYQLLYVTCSDYVGTLNSNDGGCTGGNANASVQSSPILPPPLANTGCNFIRAAVAASALMAMVSLSSMLYYVKQFLFADTEPHVSETRIEIIGTLIILGIAFAAVLIFGAILGSNC